MEFKIVEGYGTTLDKDDMWNKYDAMREEAEEGLKRRVDSAVRDGWRRDVSVQVVTYSVDEVMEFKTIYVSAFVDYGKKFDDVLEKVNQGLGLLVSAAMTDGWECNGSVQLLEINSTNIRIAQVMQRRKE